MIKSKTSVPITVDTADERKLLAAYRGMRDVDRDMLVRFAEVSAIEAPRESTKPKLRLVSGFAM